MLLKPARLFSVLLLVAGCQTYETPPSGQFKPACTQHPYDAGRCDIPVKWSGWRWFITGNGE
jgi:hypothetical protein